MKKVLLSLLTVAAVGTLAFGASRAFFSDTEKSVGNSFTAGAIDLTIDSTCSYNGQPLLNSPKCGTWVLKDLNLTSDKFFNFTDIKPGDWGENTISMHVTSNDAWACLTIDNMHNDGNGLTEPEIAANDLADGVNEGELAQNLYFTAWADDGDNIWEAGEPLLFTNKLGPASDVLNSKTYALADSTIGNPILGGTTRNIGLEWCFGTMTVDEATHTIACDGSNAGNGTQTDSLTADVTFYVVQARNNPTFVCSSLEPHRLVLENKDPNYNRILNDGIYGILTWAGDGDTFKYNFEGYGLTSGINYSLLYYGDPWSGNHPGYYFGNDMADVSGRVTINGNPDLLMDLPGPGDANPGAKIWLIPSTAYDSINKSVTVWPFANDWLFESNLINYNDTNN